jgi:hypothetical protein
MGSKDNTEDSGFYAGSRRERPHSSTGWTTNRDSEASAPLQTPPPDGPGGFSWTGRKKS